MHSYSTETAMTFRLRAMQAEAEAARTADALAREVLITVAETWREIALASARAERRRKVRPKRAANVFAGTS